MIIDIVDITGMLCRNSFTNSSQIFFDFNARSKASGFNVGGCGVGSGGAVDHTTDTAPQENVQYLRLKLVHFTALSPIEDNYSFSSCGIIVMAMKASGG